ncbi:tachylectin-related carbohydrate-binding protein [Lentzea rhizosphaerae]|uniref:Tachylectin-related carbohydrate-binding protein n=1 Tax=Lentzea rhizosphaerae TaxID=2041025 RepID=A0ABV8C3I1_9PSEU
MHSAQPRAASTWRRIVAPVLVVLSLLTFARPAAADISYLRAALYASCADQAPVYSVKDNGDLWLTAHTGARSGRNTWGTATRIATGWSGRVLAAPGGVLHRIEADGTVKRFRWNGTGWDDALGTVTGSGWGSYAVGAGRDLITVDSDGVLFRLDGGLLVMHRFDGTRWSEGEIVDDGWGSYTSVVAAGSGVLYTRTADGAVFRHHLDTASKTWLQRHLKTGRDLGTGRLVSAGADTLYRLTGTGDLVWQRFVPAKSEWVTTDRADGTTVGTGWTGLSELTVAPDACTLRNPLKPVHQLMQLGLGAITAGEIVTTIKAVVAETGVSNARMRVLATEVAAYAQANWPAVEQAKAELDALLVAPNPEQALVTAARAKFAAAQGLELPQYKELNALLEKARADAPKIRQTIDQYRGFVDVFVDEGRKLIVRLRDVAQSFREIPPFTLPADFKVDIDLAALEEMGRGWDQMNADLTRMSESINASMAQLNASMAAFDRTMDNFNRGMADFNRTLAEMDAAMKRFNSGTWWPTGGFSLNGLKFDFDRVFPQGTTREEREATDRKVSTLVGFIPFVGTGKGIADAIAGRDLMTGERLGGIDRALNLVPMLRPAKQVMNGADAVHSAERLHDASRGTGNVVDGVRLNARLAGQEISNGHAFQKHVVEQGEFPGVRTRGEFAQLVETTILKGEMRPLNGNRLAYWYNGMIVIRNPRAADGGTAFAPRDGYNYFLNVP